MHSPDHELLAAAGELRGEKPWKVTLDEGEDEDVADGGDRRDQDYGKGDEGQDVTGRPAYGQYLTRLERCTCSAKNVRG